ncbi:energy-coupling factor transporter transmembrane component T family protein [Haladaptatus halobius]|uniref:energy-coupling factor transporter transmembrane component T family protein n=1 Tax=Haladaptatus halobius TaxID=2884875 RepID=UPI001D0B5210|nr:energy-coupling factor transporter transmembrane component T [Haladaptatus halobius]
MPESDISIYQPGESILHRMNPVTEIVLATSLSLVVFIVGDYRIPLILALVLLGFVFVARVHKLVLKLYGAVAVPFAFFLLLIQGILLKPVDPTPLFTFGSVTVWQSGFEQARLIFLRISVLILAFLLFATTAQPQRLRIALMEKGVPSKLAYVFIASLQIIPEIRARAGAISEAQQARGLDTTADIRTRLSSIVALLAPLLISTLIVANTRALALNARGFQATGPRTYLYEVPDPTGERVLRYLGGVAVIVAIAWRILA